MQDHQMTPPGAVFADLNSKNLELTSNRNRLRTLFTKLSDANGSGDDIRRKIVDSVLQLITKSRTNGAA